MKLLASLILLAAAAQPAQVPPEPPPGAPNGSSQRTPGDSRYDEVGYAAVGAPIVAARGLAAGSYAEVTALASGRTILVAIGAASSGALIELTGADAAALGIEDHAPVRVRRVAATPQDAVMLRQGHPASSRLDTPPAVLAALRKLLPATPIVKPAPIATAKPATPARPAKMPKPVATPAPLATPPAPAVAATAPAPKPAKPEPKPTATPSPALAVRYFVQAGIFASESGAKALATKLGGAVSPVGKLFRVRIGPLADRAAADQAKAVAVRSGAPGAQIFTVR